MICVVTKYWGGGGGDKIKEDEVGEMRNLHRILV
jgi:hypothetical protein